MATRYSPLQIGRPAPTGAWRPPPPPKPPGPNLPPSYLQQYLDTLLTGPDYSDVRAPDWDAISQMAQHQAEASFVPIQQFTEAERARQGALKETSTTAASNFSQAMAEILTGGQGSEEERMAYAKEHFGGSYMGAIASQMGQELIARITHDFTQRDFELGVQLGEAMSKFPEIKSQILSEIVAAESDRYERQIDVAEEEFETRLKRMAALYELEKESQETAGGGEEWSDPYRLKGTNKIVQRNKATGKLTTVGTLPSSGQGSAPREIGGYMWYPTKNGGWKRGEKLAGASGYSYSDQQQDMKEASAGYYRLIEGGYTPKQALAYIRNQLRVNSEYPTPGKWTPSPAQAPEPKQTYTYKRDKQGNMWEIDDLTGRQKIIVKASETKANKPTYFTGADGRRYMIDPSKPGVAVPVKGSPARPPGGSKGESQGEVVQDLYDWASKHVRLEPSGANRGRVTKAAQDAFLQRLIAAGYSREQALLKIKQAIGYAQGQAKSGGASGADDGFG